MTVQLDSLAAMATVLIQREAAMAVALESGLERALVRIETTAKAEFGTYQRATGPFPAWAELADATKADRVHQGFPANEPLLRTGEMRDSIQHERDLLEGVVGSTDGKMLFHELGTSTIPARPVLGPAAFRNKTAIQKLVGAAVLAGFVGTFSDPNDVNGYRIAAGLGYDIDVKD